MNPINKLVVASLIPKPPKGSKRPDEGPWWVYFAGGLVLAGLITLVGWYYQ